MILFTEEAAIFLALITSVLSSITTGVILYWRLRGGVTTRMTTIATLVSFVVSVFFAGAYVLMLAGTTAGTILHPSVSVALTLIMLYSVVAYRYELRLVVDATLSDRMVSVEGREVALGVRIANLESRLAVLEDLAGNNGSTRELGSHSRAGHDPSGVGSGHGTGQGEARSRTAEG